MADAITALEVDLQASPKKWLVTGAAGFIGSNLVERLLRLGQHVVGLDDFSTGYQENLEEVENLVGESAWQRFRFIRGDVANIDDCRASVSQIDYVLHQAALGSVPRSIEDPIRTNRANVDGFLNILVAARDAGVRRFVYASSSSVYGDSEELPKVEERIGNQLSPYAVSKRSNELYAAVFSQLYEIETIGLRYFNVFGPRQDPEGAYAAVVPRWMAALAAGGKCMVYGDGQTSRDFCYIANVVQANLLAACTESSLGSSAVFNVACAEQTSLLQLHGVIADGVNRMAGISAGTPDFSEFRPGDVRHSLADIGQITRCLGYRPTHLLAAGIDETLRWYFSRSNGR